jgi:epsilon-lactone hydrolase
MIGGNGYAPSILEVIKKRMPEATESGISLPPLATGPSVGSLSLAAAHADGSSNPYGSKCKVEEKSMRTEIHENPTMKKSWSVVHPLSPEDSVTMTTLRAAVAAMKGKLEGTAARAPFNAIMEHVPAPDGVSFKADTVGGIAGCWAMPAQAGKGVAILHLHGGWFNWGTAQAFRNFVGHIAKSAGVDAFIPDYRLAPEQPFPAAVKDAEACYRGLVDRSIKKIALTGDSAGGNLALVLLSITTAQVGSTGIAPVGAVVLSPVTDLALTGESFETRAEADPYFVRPQAAGLVRSYLGKSDPKNPLASPLYGDLTGLPAIRVHVGDDEVLLDDSRRYVERAAAAGVDATLDTWMGMPHGFVNGVGRMHAANQALRAIGAFLNDRLEAAR